MWRAAEEAVVAGDVATLEALNYEAGEARAIIASTHHFATWDEFEAHREARRDAASPIARFERAVDAIVSGDTATLALLLGGDPDLVTARSRRQHHSTLLHYAGANGVEAFRQHTPPNAVAIASLLLDAGADVDAVADMYRGSTTLGLVATSLHPKVAGVQQPLMELLLDRGAALDIVAAAGGPSLVHSCLANGRPEAAEFLASRGAPLDLASAAGVGRLDVVRSYFDGHRKASVTEERMASALLLAAFNGRTTTAEFLLDRGAAVDASSDGFTGVNAAATAGHLDTVRLFIARGASLELKNRYGGTALGGALWGAANAPRDVDYVPVIETLVAAGARVDSSMAQWWEERGKASPDAHARLLELLRSKA